MNQSTFHDSDSSLSILLFGLMISCPCGRPLKNCPLQQLRKQGNLESKFDLANQLTSTQVRAIIDQHNVCFSSRLRNGLGSKNHSPQPRRQFSHAAGE